MSKRRSLDDALDPEQQAFLGGTPPPSDQPTQKEEPPMAQPALKQEYVPETPMMFSVPMPAALPGVVALNVRIEPEISAALMRASIERKIQRLTPFTQRDIVAEALADWLRAKGYLN